jgi:hemoglobin
MSGEGNLYEQLGGKEGVETVVDEFYDRVLADEQLAGYFEDTELSDLKAHQRAFIGSVTGGPVEYTGEDMRTAHAHLDLTPADFAAVAEHLDTALRSAGVADPDREAVLEAVAGLEDEVLANS